MVELHAARLVGFNGLASALPQKPRNLRQLAAVVGAETRRAAPDLAISRRVGIMELLWMYQGTIMDLLWNYHGSIMELSNR